MDHDIRKNQFVAVTKWTGGLYVSPTIAGSRLGALIARAWAAMMSLGLEGYLENTRKIMEASKRIEKGSIHFSSKLPRDEDDNRFDPMDSHISSQSESIGV